MTYEERAEALRAVAECLSAASDALDEALRRASELDEVDAEQLMPSTIEVPDSLAQTLDDAAGATLDRADRLDGGRVHGH